MDDEKFLKILELVDKGINISDAIKHIGLKRKFFYENATEEQKLEVYFAKIVLTGYYELPY